VLALLEAAGGTPAVALRAIALAAITVATGAIVFHWCVVPRTGDDVRSSRAARARRATTVGFFSCGVLLLVAFPRLWFQAQAFADSGVSPLTMIPNVRRTTWGVGLAVQCVSAAIAFLGFIVGRVRPRVGWWIATLAILGLTVSPAMMGHPIAAERNVWLNVVADWVHVMSAGGWIGALSLLALASARVSDAVMGELIAAFHRVALVSVVALFVSGASSLWLRIAHLAALFGSTYGTIYFVKLACVACVLALGAWHSRRGEASARGGGMIGKTLAVELFFAMITIGVTAVLIGSEPPGV
jgi:putative copper export protein